MVDGHFHVECLLLQADRYEAVFFSYKLNYKVITFLIVHVIATTVIVILHLWQAKG